MNATDQNKYDSKEIMVLKINLPLANKSLFFRVSQPNQTIREILEQGIRDLEQDGKFFEAKQIAEYLSNMK